MLTRREITVGKCYINDRAQLLREIQRVDRDRVICNTYDLADGKLLGMPQGALRRQDLIRWADREASPEERAMLQRHELQALYQPGFETVDINIARSSMEGGAAEARFSPR